MKTQLIAVLLISGAVVATPAFAGNNASNAPLTSFTIASASSDTGAKSRAEVRAELVDAVQGKSMAPQGDHVDPSYAAISRLVPVVREPGMALMDRERP